LRNQVNPDRYYEEPDPTDYEALDAERDTRAADDADAQRKEKP
jgi:hypothetical protein